jgi:hypothetical protein
LTQKQKWQFSKLMERQCSLQRAGAGICRRKKRKLQRGFQKTGCRNRNFGRRPKRRDFTINAMAISLNKENFGELD